MTICLVCKITLCENICGKSQRVLKLHANFSDKGIIFLTSYAMPKFGINIYYSFQMVFIEIKHITDFIELFYTHLISLQARFLKKGSGMALHTGYCFNIV